METYRHARIFLAIAVVAALFLFLGTHGLIEPDEGRYAEIGREMAADGDWVIPHMDGFAHLSNPPMIYWLTAASIKAFGANEWAARLPSALAALGTVWLVFLTGRSLFGPAAGIAAALVLLSSLEFFILARTLTPDMVLTFWTTAALACFVQFARGKRSSGQWGFFIAMGFGFLTRGPMALVVPVSAALFWQMAMKKIGAPIRILWFRGLSLTLVIGLSWFLILSLRYPLLFHYFLRYEFADPFTTSLRGRGQPFWFFVPVLLVGLLPWTIFLPALAITVWRHWRKTRQRLILGWFVVPFLVPSASGSKSLTYVLPLLPAFALAFAGWWNSGTARGLVQQHTKIGSLFFLAFSIALVVVVEGFPRLGLIFSPVFLLCISAFACVLVLLIWFFQQRVFTVFFLMAGGTLSLWLILAAQVEKVSPLFDRQASVRPLVREVKEMKAENAAIFSYGVRANGLEFYLRRLVGISVPEADLVIPPTHAQSLRLLHSPVDCARLGTAGTPVYGLVRADEFEKTFSLREWRVLGRNADFLIIGTNPVQPPTNGCGNQSRKRGHCCFAGSRTWLQPFGAQRPGPGAGPAHADELRLWQKF
ncbi:MAG: hypothetical protein DME26_07040 [Verrucomicrobia bacterium]|nr:MAG: hypothetical protein DME26_07040 [Verrucomicrobiota bacterium]